MSVWKTRDGREVKISEMSDSHLANTVAFLLRNRTICIMRGTPRTEDEEFLPAFGKLFDTYVLEGVVPEWPELLAEAKRRQLC